MEKGRVSVWMRLCGICSVEDLKGKDKKGENKNLTTMTLISSNLM